MLDFFYKARGVITVFLLIIMLPVFTAAVLLVDGTRYQSAKTMVQEAGDLAAYSTIADYNMELKDNFGLFAINSPDATAAFMKYFKETLGYSTSEAETYTQKVQNLITNSLFQGNEYAGKNFYNMYNFEVDESATSVTPMYPLSEPGVLQNQIVEYTKYRGVETLLERFEILNQFDKLEEEAEDNSKVMEAINEVSDVDQGLNREALAALEQWIITVKDYNSALSNLVSYAYRYEEAAITEVTHMIVNDRAEAKSAKNQRDNASTNLSAAYDRVITKHDKIGTAREKVETKVNAAIAKYEELKVKYASQTDIVEDINSEIELLKKIVSTNSADRDYSAVLLESEEWEKSPLDMCEETLETFRRMESALKDTHSQNDNEYNREKNALLDAGEMTAEEIETYLYENVVYHVVNYDYHEIPATANKEYLWESINDEIRNIATTTIKDNRLHSTILNRYDNQLYMTVPRNAYGESIEDDNKVKYKDENGNEQEITVDKNTNQAGTAKDQANKREEPAKDDSIERKTIDDAQYSVLPTQLANVGAESEKQIAAVSDDNASSFIDSASTAGSDFLKILESTRNDVLTFSYMFETFKTRNSCTDYSSKTKNAWYSTKWRFNSGGEVNFRDVSKKNLQTYFGTAEVEYLFGGNKHESVNETIVYSWIYGTRLANNIVAVYMNPRAKAECLALAAVSSALTGGFVPVSVFKWIYIAAWAAGETALEMTYLITDGYRVPLIKTKNDLFIKSFASIGTALAPEMRENLMKAVSGTGINVCYEDYLLILLCFVGREKRLLRTADLIQLNMRTMGNADFKMSEAYTYIKADTVVKMKYLFQPIKQFQNSYNGIGLILKNTIYQGY